MKSSRRAPVRSSRIVAAALTGFVVLSGSGAARAQSFYEPDLPMPPRAVVWRLNDRGFTQVTRPHFDGRAYVVEASAPYGERVRLFVDPRDGAILGRQRLEALPSIRVARPAPGYGWTEDEVTPRRAIREAERMVPPADIPYPQASARAPRFDAPARPDIALRPEPADRNPLGVNPDAKPRIEPPRKVVRLTPPTKPAAPRLAPEAPKPVETAAPPAPVKPEPSSAALETPQAAPSTPPAVQPPPAEAAAPAQAWKDPPAEPRKPVRVIGGATVVPGTGETAQ